MRGVGGPLLCIGDLLNDVGEADRDNLPVAVDFPLSPSSSSSSSSLPDSNRNLQTSDLSKLFQENYNQLKDALAGTDHSWTALTLKLCTALDTADKLVQSTNSHARLLSENVQELERVIKRSDSAIEAAKSIHNTLNQTERSFKAKRGSDHIQG